MTGWCMDERDRDTVIPSDQGITLVAGTQAERQVPGVGAVCLGGCNDHQRPATAGGGPGLHRTVRQPEQHYRLRLLLAQPRSDQSREEKVVEVFEGFQVSRFTQISIGAQAIFDPGNNPDTNLLGVFYARLRLAF